MKKILKLVVLIATISISTFPIIAQAIPNDSLYLGQTPPGNTPKVFNLPLTSGHRACERIAITSDGKEIYYGELDSYPPSSYRVRCFKYIDNKWQGPFNVFERYITPSLSINDSIIYLLNNYIYYSTRTDSGWSVPVKLLSSNQRMHYFQRTNLNNSYASSYYEGSPTDGNISKVIVVNKDTILQSLGIPLNSSAEENDFYIARDESFIFFSKNVTGGAGDIYLSFKKDNGNWTNPKKLGEPINRPGANWEYGMFVSKDKKYLFYTSGGMSMSSYYTYWVKIDNIIDSLKRTNYAPYLKTQIPNQVDSVSYKYNYTFSDTTFIDDDGNNTLTYSATLSNGNPLPSWLSFNSVTRTFNGTPTSAGTLFLKITAADTAHAQVFCTFNLKINNLVTSVDKNEKSLNEFRLFQNYPNPFNPTTKINWYSPVNDWQSLKIYDILGNEIATLVDEFKPAGNYQVEFNSENISSGIYFYVLNASVYSKQMKMIVLK